MTERELPETAENTELLLDPADEAAFAEALRAAFAPGELDPLRHTEILALALEDPFAAPTEEEVRASERLRAALESDDSAHPDAALARALRAATSPQPLAAEQARRLAASTTPRRPNVVYVTFGAVAVAAAAALALLVVRPGSAPEGAAGSSQAALLRSRTTQDLFHDRFEPGQATARIDRIASARARDWRENQYALWGVR
jgi:hypothetical protein